jgi:hypothetical protein
MGASVQHMRRGIYVAVQSRSGASPERDARHPWGLRCFCGEGVPPASSDSESPLSSELDQPTFVSRLDTAPSALSWSAQNATAKQRKPCIAAACYLRCASTASRGCQPLEARARAHNENNIVFPYVFSGPEADFGRWPSDPRGGSRGGIAGWAAAIGPQRPRESDGSASRGPRVQTAESPL